MAVSWSYVRHLVHLFLRINYFPFALVWSFSFLCLFFIRVFLFDIIFSRLLYGATQMDQDGLGSCASHSESLISLSYLMAVFSTKSFGLFFIKNPFKFNYLVVFMILLSVFLDLFRKTHVYLSVCPWFWLVYSQLVVVQLYIV